METKYLLAAAVLSTFLLVACWYNEEPLFSNGCDEDCITFTGTVADPTTGIGIRDVEVEVQFDNSRLFSLAISKFRIGLTKTDADGHFTFSFPGENYRTGEGFFQLLLQRDGYIAFNWRDIVEESAPIYVDSTSFDNPISSDAFMYEPALVNVALQKSAPDGYSDVRFSIYDATGVKYNQTFLAAFSDTVLVRRVGAGQQIYFQVDYRQDNEPRTVIDSLFILPKQEKNIALVI